MDPHARDLDLFGAFHAQRELFCDFIFDGITADEESQAERNSLMRSKLKCRRTVPKPAAKPAEQMTAEYLMFHSVTTETSPAEISPSVPWLTNRCTGSPFLRLHEEILAVVDFVGLTEAERAMRSGLIDQLRRAVASEFGPKAEMRIFGSFVTNLSLYDSDVDIVVTDVDTDSVVESLGQLKQRLSEDGLLASRWELISNTKVPILKFRSPCGVWVDICINESAAGTDFMRRNLAKRPAMRPMIILLKLFLRQRQLQNTYTGGVGSFLLFCMVLSFFQRRVSNSMCEAPTGELSLGHLLYEFLRLWAVDFNYWDLGISVSGDPAYFKRWSRENDKGNYLHLESPIDPEIDLGKTAFMFDSVRKSFCHALVNLQFNFAHGTKSLLENIVPGDHALILERPQRKSARSMSEPITPKKAPGSVSSDAPTRTPESGEDPVADFLREIDSERPRRKKRKRKRSLTLAERLQRSTSVNSERDSVKDGRKRLKEKVPMLDGGPPNKSIFNVEIDTWSS